VTGKGANRSAQFVKGHRVGYLAPAVSLNQSRLVGFRPAVHRDRIADAFELRAKFMQACGVRGVA
jgi:hypothetical protein